MKTYLKRISALLTAVVMSLVVMTSSAFAAIPTSNPDDFTLTHCVKTVPTSVGSVTLNVLTVNTKNPNVSVKSALVDGTIGKTAPFSKIVESSGGAAAAINSNFFASYSNHKAPIGHVMVDGEFLYGNSGISSLGITKDGEIRVGRPALFTRIKETTGRNNWTAYEINTKSQGKDFSVLYTPAFGANVPITASGKILTVINDVITGYEDVAAGTSVAIPAGGYLVYMGSGFTSTNYFRTPRVGKSVKLEYYLPKADPEGFKLDNMASIVSGAPRLVQDGAIVTTLEPNFTGSRFTTDSAPRTAIGVNSDGYLVLVNTAGATIQQMREAMLAIGCVDAINLDGGASCGMYYNGTYLSTPGRELTTTLQVFVKG